MTLIGLAGHNHRRKPAPLFMEALTGPIRKRNNDTGSRRIRNLP